MTILFISDDDNAQRWCDAIARHLEGFDAANDFRIWPDDGGDPAAVDIALVRLPKPGVLAGYTNLKAVLNLGAGVDDLLADPAFPRHVPLGRMVDDSLSGGMVEYVVHGVLHFYRAFPAYARSQEEHRWQPLAHLPDPGRWPLGIMGLGVLGRAAAAALGSFGFPLLGWSRTAKEIEGIEVFAGPEGFGDFLGRTRILICLLPLTPETENILDRNAFDRLPKGAYIINAARGGHLVEEDLIAALDGGHLEGALLDVFRDEPLAAESPFWDHAKVIATPHVASISPSRNFAAEIANDITRVRAGGPPRHLVNMKSGY
ncbi:MAG TPA: glyoxylate/hydroxypyruvate reductase A [Alphaproteobacteria bacterium]|nr:glyoxylate/hydroxypyruvate reductase A [Alphaproteobacteria bacterium]